MAGGRAGSRPAPRSSSRQPRGHATVSGGQVDEALTQLADSLRREAGPAPLDDHGDMGVVGLDVVSGEEGAVTLADGLAQFETTIYREVDAGDHTIVLLRLHAVAHADHSQPLVFHRSAFGRLQDPV